MSQFKKSNFTRVVGKLLQIPRRKFMFQVSVVVLILALGLPIGIPSSAAQSPSGTIRLIRALESEESGILQPVGIAFSARANAFQVSERQGPADDTGLVKLTPFADRAGEARLAAAIRDPINVTFDDQIGRLLILHASDNQLLEVREDGSGNLDVSTLTRHDIRHLGLQDPQGMTFDPASSVLYILDASGPRVVRVQLNADGSFANAVFSVIDLRLGDVGSVRGLAFDPRTGTLHVGVPAAQRLYEVTLSGEVATERDLTEFGFKNPQGMVFAPSTDQTDDPSQINLFLADSGDNNGQVTSDSQSTGQIMELSTTAGIEAEAVAAASFNSTLIRTINLASISPPSPDPSGIAFLSGSNRLVVVDGEVEETVNNITHFQGANLWVLTLNGGVVRTANISKRAPTVVPMANEPTGVAFNPANGHYFVTDDGQKKVFDLNPGMDGQIGTSDDSWTSFDTLPAGNGDPEGITFHAQRNSLFVADGVNREIYEYTLTGNPVGHFDVGAYGIEDPESVEFNSDSGTLFVMSSNRPTPLIVETTVGGAILQTINISAANPRVAAGLAYAPASNGSGAKRFYIVDRGIDNNSDPNIVDGKIYEMTTTGSVTPPTATFTPTRTPTGGTGPSPTPTRTSTPSSSDEIFADSFESGNFSAWSANKPDAGDLSVTAGAALVGTRGMQALLDDTVTIFVTDDRPNAEPRYRTRFYFDPNSINMASGNAHFIFQGFMGTSPAVVRVDFRNSSGAYQIRGQLLNDGSSWTSTNWFTIGDASHAIELDWRAATGAGANNGGLTLWIDGVQQANITGVDNDTRRIDRVRLGAVAGLDAGTSGTYYFDAFVSRRQTYIGP